MKKLSMVFLWLLGTFSVFDSVSYAAPKPQSREMVTPAWFVQKASSGLTTTPNGQLRYEKKLLPPIPISRNLFGAAYYPARRALLVVSKNATVTYYSQQKGGFLQLGSFAPKYEARAASVRFTRIPGLVYVLAIDVKQEKSLKGDGSGYVKIQQTYPDHYYRVALTKAAQKWQAVPVADAEEKLLGGCYQVAGRRLNLSLAQDKRVNAKRTNIRLPQALAPPFRSGPFDDLAQSVFVFPKNGIVCWTKNGWALFDINGKLRKWFSVRNIHGGWWSDPTFKAGQFYVEFRTGPGGDTYRMDAAKGKLVKMSR